MYIFKNPDGSVTNIDNSRWGQPTLIRIVNLIDCHALVDDMIKSEPQKSSVRLTILRRFSEGRMYGLFIPETPVMTDIDAWRAPLFVKGSHTIHLLPCIAVIKPNGKTSLQWIWIRRSVRQNGFSLVIRSNLTADKEEQLLPLQQNQINI